MFDKTKKFDETNENASENSKWPVHYNCDYGSGTRWKFRIPNAQHKTNRKNWRVIILDVYKQRLFVLVLHIFLTGSVSSLKAEWDVEFKPSKQKKIARPEAMCAKDSYRISWIFQFLIVFEAIQQAFGKSNFVLEKSFRKKTFSRKRIRRKKYF